jgi:hypothetical protein
MACLVLLDYPVKSGVYGRVRQSGLACNILKGFTFAMGDDGSGAVGGEVR